MRLPKDLLSGIYTKPRIFLCEADKERICQLETTNTSATLKFNSYSELSFEVGRTYNNVSTGETLVNPYYDKIEAVRLVEVDGFGYFEIQGPELISDGIKEAKNITAYSLEYTLSTKYISNFLVNTGAIGSVEVTEAENRGDINNIRPVTLYNTSDTSLSLLHLVLKDVYGWSIGHVDASLQTLSRSFEIDRVSVYDFLMNDVCEKFNCYIVFDTINNKINVYAESLTAKFIGDGNTKTFTVSPPFYKIGTVSVDGYKTTQWKYNSQTGTVELDEAPADGSHIEVVDGALTEWETDVFVSFNNLSQEINVNYDADSIKTKLTVTYGEDGDIRETNLGLPYLTDISYYYNVDWMGQDLYDAYTTYIKKSNKYQKQYTSNSQEILKLNDQIYYEETRLSLEYSLVQSVGPTTVGTYYVEQKKADGSRYYKEVSLPGEYVAGTNYYSNATANVTEDKVSALYAVLKKYFNNENTDDDSGDKPITSWKTDLGKLNRDFEFMKTYTLSYLSTQLSKVTKNRIGNATAEGAINNFLSEVWSELGRTPLKQLYLAPYEEIKDANIKAGWSNKNSDNYGYYYPVLLVIASLEAEIKKRNKLIGKYEADREDYYKKNESISNQLAMDKNFTPKQLTRLNAFLREDELHIDDIVETGQDDLSSSFKVKQDAMESGRIELQKLCQPQLQFSMTMANIYALPEFEPIIDQFQLGKVIKVELRPNYIKQSRLLQVNINFDDFSDFSCEFGELTDIRTQSEIHADLLKNAITAGKSVATNSSRWTRGSDTATSVDLKIQQGLLDAATQIKAIDGNQGVVIDKYGIHLQKVDPTTGELDPKQGWIVNNQFLFSDDGFKSAKSVFGEFSYDGETHYGILAETLVGSLIIGSQIKLENKDSTMTFDGDGLSVKNDTHSFNVNPSKNDSIISLSKGNEKILYVDSDGTLNVNGTIYASSGTIAEWNIGSKLIYKNQYDEINNKSYSAAMRSGTNMALAVYEKAGEQTGAPSVAGGWDYNFYVSYAGKLYANNAEITGKITATSLTLDGCKIPYDNISGAPDVSIYITKDGEILRGTPSQGSTGIKISSTGLLEASNAVIYGSVFASSGTVGGWNITSNWIESHVDDSKKQFYLGSAQADIINWIAARNDSGDITFRVSRDGILHATGAKVTGEIVATSGEFTGKVTASAGEIGGWSIGGNRISTNSGSAEFYLASAGATSYSNWIVAKDSSGNTTFKVAKSDGSVYMKGEIDASGGSIGGWTIASNRLSSGDLSNETGTLVNGSTGYSRYAFAAGTPQNSDGKPDYGNAKFRVTHAGKLYATDAIVDGKITATSGSFDRSITIGGRSISEWMSSAGYITNIKATSGTIGGWNITETYIGGSDTSAYYTRLYSDGKDFYVNADKSATNTFFFVVYAGTTPIGGISPVGWQSIYA